MFRILIVTAMWLVAVPALAQIPGDEDSGTESVEGSGLDTVEGTGLDTVEGTGLDTVEGTGLDTVEGTGLDTVEGTGLQSVEGTARESGAEARTHTVRSGDTLRGLAMQYYGDAGAYRRIYDANRAVLSDPNNLPTGTLLTIP